MAIGRVVNVLVPMQYKNVIDSLGGFAVNATAQYLDSGDVTKIYISPRDIPFIQIIVFVVLRFLSGGVGLLSSLEDFLYIPVGQVTTRLISVKMFAHLHSLSLRYHLHRKTGEILRIQDRGVASIVSLLSNILFEIFPCLLDIFMACAYFTLYFDIYFGFIVFLTMTSYIFFTVLITEWRTKYRKLGNFLENAMEAKAVDSLLNFETVKYYNAEDFEIGKKKKE